MQHRPPGTVDIERTQRDGPAPRPPAGPPDTVAPRAAGDDPALDAWRRRTDLPLLTLGIGSVPLLLLELVRDDLPSSDRILLWVVNIVVAAAFTIDYLVELSLSSDRWRHVRSEKIGAAIVISSVLAVVPALTLAGGTRLVRLAPALRALAAIIRLSASGGLAAREGRRLVRRSALRTALSVTGLTWLTSAVVFTIAEGVGRQGRVGSFFEGLWWSAATITTVGYGDLAPVTPAGRIAGVFAMVVGITSFGLMTAQFAAFLSRADPD